MQPVVLRQGEGGSLGGSHQSAAGALTHEKDQSSAEGGAAQPEQAPARPATTKCASRPGHVSVHILCLHQHVPGLQWICIDIDGKQKMVLLTIMTAIYLE